ncbi:MAG TPA: DUF952 domain-containing protein [Flavisolibacter sp.]|nr:DUF952 domain-containing protein [Flavisolibacter sp.]
MAAIYHITSQTEWNNATKTGSYTAPSLKTEGFIHCSKAEQVQGVLQRYFAGKINLVKLTIDTTKLTAPLRYELAPSLNEEFPHIYGTINPDAVIKVEEISGE